MIKCKHTQAWLVGKMGKGKENHLKPVGRMKNKDIWDRCVINES